jgi:hypothetical protein
MRQAFAGQLSFQRRVCGTIIDAAYITTLPILITTHARQPKL